MYWRGLWAIFGKYLDSLKKIIGAWIHFLAICGPGAEYVHLKFYFFVVIYVHTYTWLGACMEVRVTVGPASLLWPYGFLPSTWVAGVGNQHCYLWAVSATPVCEVLSFLGQAIQGWSHLRRRLLDWGIAFTRLDHGHPGSIFLINDGCGRAQPIVGSASPEKVVLVV